MAAIDVVRKYLDAGMSSAQVTREKAEEIVRDLVKAGEVRAEVEDLVVDGCAGEECVLHRMNDVEVGNGVPSV